jgi:hypothetical protein
MPGAGQEHDDESGERPGQDTRRLVGEAGEAEEQQDSGERYRSAARPPVPHAPTVDLAGNC